ncbi:MAG: hypothetical protein AAGE18_01135 [Pseudomonadota bacterium]
MRQVYVSITGLRLHRPWHAPLFWWHALASMRQAQAADGNLMAETRTIDGVHHTLSVWRDRAALRHYLYSGSHGRAIRAFPTIASGATCGFLAEGPPGWDEVHEIWRTQGHPYPRAA